MGIISFESKSSMLADLDSKVNLCLAFEDRIMRCPADLPSLVSLHKEIWNAGIRNRHLGEGSMFHCRDVSKITLSDVYLGNIGGIWTNTAEFFESRRYAEPSVYKSVVEQYRNHLLRNTKYERDLVYDGGISRSNLEDWISIVYSNHLRRKVEVKIDCPFLCEDAVIPCRLRYGGEIVSSSFALIGRERIIFPKDFEKGIIITPKNLGKLTFSSMLDRFEPMSYYWKSEKDFKFLPVMSSREEIGRKELKRIHRGLHW